MTVVFDTSGRPMRLIGPARSGGEGTVARVEGDATTAVKLYHPGRATDELHQKIRTMAANPPTEPVRGHTSIAWPTGPVFADRGGHRFVGFAMPFVDTDTFREAHVYYDPEDRLRAYGGTFTWQHLLGAAANLASAVAAIHASGHRIGDLRETNVLVSPTALVTLIDCDSFQVRDPQTGHVFPTRVGSGEYLPPELHGIDFSAESPDRHDADLFALAVLVFRFLMGGVHPFQARGKAVEHTPSVEAKIAAGRFPYAWSGRGVAPPEFAPDYRRVVPPRARRLFKKAFVSGHHNPSARPAAARWRATLRSISTRTCPDNPHHHHAGRSCPWCVEPVDPFPDSAAGRQRALDGARRVPVTAAVGATGPPKPRPEPTEQLVMASERLRAARTTDRARWVAAARLLLPAVLAAALAPVATVALLVLVVTPAIATAGSLHSRRRVLLAPARFAVHLHRSLVGVVQRLVPVALAAALPYLALALLWSPTLAFRAGGVVLAAGWVAWGASLDPDVGSGWEELHRAPITRRWWAWTPSLALIVALAVDRVVTWPLPSVPF